MNYSVFTLLASILLSTASSYAQQVGIEAGASAPNGAQIGVNYEINKTFGVSASYGYLKIGDSGALEFRAKKGKIYAFASANYIATNEYGEVLITDGINYQVRQSTKENATYKKAFSGYKANAADYQVSDLQIGGGIGVQFGWFFVQLGLRGTQVRTEFNEKADNAIRSIQAYAEEAFPDATIDQKSQIQIELAGVRAELQTQFEKMADKAPADLKVLPEFRFGFRFPLWTMPNGHHTSYNPDHKYGNGYKRKVKYMRRHR